MIGCFYFWVRVPKIDSPSQFLKNPFVHSPFLFPPLGLGGTFEALGSKLDFANKANRSCLTDVSFFGLVLAFCSHRSARFLIDEETRPQCCALWVLSSVQHPLDAAYNSCLSAVAGPRISSGSCSPQDQAALSHSSCLSGVVANQHQAGV